MLSLTGGIGLIIYGMGWLVVPQEGERESEAHRLLSGRIEGAPLTAVLMALVGCGLYASMLGNGANQAFSLLLLAATAGAVYWSQQRRARRPGRRVHRGRDRRPTRAPSAVADAPPAVQAPPEPGTASWWRDPLTQGARAAICGARTTVRTTASDRKRVAGAEERRAPERRNWLFGLPGLPVRGDRGGRRHRSLLAVPAGRHQRWRSAWRRRSACSAPPSWSRRSPGRARGGTVFLSLVTIAALIGAASLPKTGHGAGSQTWRPGHGRGGPALVRPRRGPRRRST